MLVHLTLFMIIRAEFDYQIAFCISAKIFSLNLVLVHVFCTVILYTDKVMTKIESMASGN
jgi:hypothetical protein